jgi:transposase
VPKKVRRKFSKQFKRDAVELCRTSGKSQSQIARELGVRDSTFSGWVAMVEAENKTGLNTSEFQEIQELRKENARLKMEVDILGKATAFFANRKP